jgi:hypothetical protein
MGKTKDLSKNTKARPKKMTDKEQSARFIETARELGVDESGERFEEAFSKLAPTKSKKTPD